MPRITVQNDSVHISDKIIDGTGKVLSDYENRIYGEVEVLSYVHGTDKPLFTRTTNTLLVTGEVFFNEKMNACRTRIGGDDWRLPSIDEYLGVNELSVIDTSDNRIADEHICGFMIGVGGAGESIDDINPVHRTSLTVPEPVPFRMVPVDDDLADAVRSKYFLRVVKGEYVYYYGKLFSAERDMSVLYEDGTPVPTNVHVIGDQNGKHISASTNYQLTIDSGEVREYFKITDGSTRRCRFNTVGLVAGYRGIKAFDPLHPETYTEYFNVKGITCANLDNRPLRHPEEVSRLRYLVHFM